MSLYLYSFQDKTNDPRLLTRCEITLIVILARRGIPRHVYEKIITDYLPRLEEVIGPKLLVPRFLDWYDVDYRGGGDDEEEDRAARIVRTVARFRAGGLTYLGVTTLNEEGRVCLFEGWVADVLEYLCEDSESGTRFLNEEMSDKAWFYVKLGPSVNNFQVIEGTNLKFGSTSGDDEEIHGFLMSDELDMTESFPMIEFELEW